MFSLLLASLLVTDAQAGFGRAPLPQDDDGPRSTSSDDTSDGQQADGEGKKKGKKGKKKQKKQKGKQRKVAGWSVQPYVTPGGGAQISDGAKTASVGADGGVLYWHKGWNGNAYVGGSYLQGGNVSGFETHVGNQIGVRRKMWGVSGGLEGFYEQQNFASGDAYLAPAWGLRTPVTTTVGPKRMFGYVGVAPAWFLNDARAAAPEAVLGDEFEWSVGAGGRFKGMSGTVGLTTRQTAAGTITTPTVSFNWR